MSFKMNNESFFDSEINLLKFKTKIGILLNTSFNSALEQTQHQLYSFNIKMLPVFILAMLIGIRCHRGGYKRYNTF